MIQLVVLSGEEVGIGARDVADGRPEGVTAGLATVRLAVGTGVAGEVGSGVGV